MILIITILLFGGIEGTYRAYRYIKMMRGDRFIRIEGEKIWVRESPKYMGRIDFYSYAVIVLTILYIGYRI